MARKKPNETVDEAGKIDRAAGDIAEGLAAEIESCREVIAYCVKRGCDETLDDYDAERTDMFASAGKLMLASAALASALARLKGEFHHHITVARQDNIPSTDNKTPGRTRTTVYPRLADDPPEPPKGRNWGEG